jgi:hypothetical protein
VITQGERLPVSNPPFLITLLNVSCAIAAPGRQLTPNAAKTTSTAKECKLEKAFRETDILFTTSPLFSCPQYPAVH